MASPVVVDGFSTTASNHPQQQRKNQQYPSSVLATVIVNGDDATTGTSKDDFVKEEESSPPPEETKTTAVPHLEIYQDDDDATMFDIVAQRAAACLFESELRRDQRGDNNQGSSNNNNNNNMLTSSATNNNVWINDAAAFALQSTLNKIKIKLPEERTGLDRDESSAWIRWMKSAPTPLIVDLSNELRAVANATISDAQFDLIRHHVGGGDGRTKFMERLGCRIVLFPSGASLSAPLREPPASFIYGKLMYGGVTRYRQLISSSSKRGPPRKAGERTDVKVSASDNIPAWIQYGGTERMYEAVDMGPTAVLEVLLLPAGQSLSGSSSSSSSSSNNDNDDDDGDMVIQNLLWKPQQMFDMVNDDISSIEESIDYVTGYSPISQSGKDRNDAFESDFKSSVGGLQKEIDAIVRRVLDGRVIRPVQEGDNIATTTVETTATQDETTTALAAAAMEAEELAVLGLTPVRGLLLYGPPGTGKTLLARQVSAKARPKNHQNCNIMVLEPTLSCFFLATDCPRSQGADT